MATAQPRTRSETKADNRRRVLAAAETVFRREGFHGASLDQVAREAGFTKGVVYSQFDSKADLFFALLEARSHERVAAVRRIAAEHGPDAGPETLVRAQAEAFAASVSGEPDWWAVVIEFMSVVARDDRLRARYATHHERLRAAIAADVERWAAARGTAPALEPRAIATAIIGATNGLTLERLIAPGDVPDALYVETQLAFVERALPRPDER